MITLYRNLHKVFPFNVYLFCEGHGVLTAVLILRIVICLEVLHLVFWIVVDDDSQWIQYSHKPLGSLIQIFPYAEFHKREVNHTFNLGNSHSLYEILHGFR